MLSVPVQLEQGGLEAALLALKAPREAG